MIPLPVAENPLISAARLEKRSELSRLLKQRWWHRLGIHGPGVNTADATGNTALHYAVSNDDDFSVRMLLDAGARTNIVNRFEGTAVHLALATGNGGLIDDILAADDGDSIDLCSPAGGDTPLHIAVRKGYRNYVRWLLDLGADPNAENDRAQTALGLAFEVRADSAIIIALIHWGGVIDPKQQKDDEGRLLARAIIEDYPDVVEALLERADGTNADSAEMSPIGWHSPTIVPRSPRCLSRPASDWGRTGRATPHFTWPVAKAT